MASHQAVSEQILQNPTSFSFDESVEIPFIKEPLPKVSLNTRFGGLISALLMIISDYIAVVTALLFAFYLRNWLVDDRIPLFEQFNPFIYFSIPMMYLCVMALEGLYVRRLPFWLKIEKVFKISLLVTIVSIGYFYFSYTEIKIPLAFIGLSFITCFIFLLVGRYSVKHLLVLAKFWQKPVLLIGAGVAAELIADAYEEDPLKGYKIVGIIEDNHLRPLIQRYPLVGKISDAKDVIKKSKIKEVVIASSGIEREQLLNLVYQLQPFVHNITIAPDVYGIPVTNLQVDTLFKQKTVMLKIQNNLLRPYNRLLKRLFDIFSCSIILLLTSPLLLAISVMIKLTSKGPVVFAHKRIGRNGKLFPCYKFRTMIPNAEAVLEQYLLEHPKIREEWEKEFKLKDDPRITKIGKFLRRTSLDELPQLFNILKGEMSLVGPRPIVTEEISKYREFIRDYYMVRPGLTGLWQVSGRSDIGYDSRVQLDSWYVRNWSFWMDIMMLLKTVKIVLSKTGAY